MKYEVKFLSDWHVGSGLGAGTETDAEVLKTEKSHPYIPGKTVKGLLKDALYEMPENQTDRGLVDTLFGWEEKDEKGKVIRTHSGTLYFSNATIGEEEQKEITSELADFLYRNISSTQINEKGVAKNNSLRTMEVCMPVSLFGEIKKFKEGIETEMTSDEKELVEKALKWTRRLGVNRNRGLGRCQFVELKNESK